MIDQRYLKKDRFGNEFLDMQAYEDDEQMYILRQMSQSSQKQRRCCLASHRIFSFLRKKKSPSVHTR